ncbi:MAG: hypothetical protein JWO36_1798 [Myxococcales bacterium]|nr:hypothetical protein [Myxococcales bacterium]
MSRDDETLLAAYLDGVGELDPSERQRVEAMLAESPELRGEADSMRAVIGRLRELPHEGTEPNWTAMAHAIRCATPEMPRPWWRRWQWIMPISALATTAAIALLLLSHPSEPTHEARHVAPVREAPATVNALWLDGEALDLDDVEPAAVEALDHDALATETDDVTGGILPATDLNWIDNLDDSAIERAEHWLDRKKS